MHVVALALVVTLTGCFFGKSNCDMVNFVLCRIDAPAGFEQSSHQYFWQAGIHRNDQYWSSIAATTTQPHTQNHALPSVKCRQWHLGRFVYKTEKNSAVHTTPSRMRSNAIIDLIVVFLLTKGFEFNWCRFFTIDILKCIVRLSFLIAAKQWLGLLFVFS